MAQTLKCWIILGRKKEETEWQLVDDPVMGHLREHISDERVHKFTSFIYWDKDLAVEVLEGMREDEKKRKLNQEYRLASLWGEVSESKGRS